MPDILKFPTAGERSHKKLERELASIGQTFDEMCAWVEADLKPRLAKLGRQLDVTDPTVKEMLCLEAELYFARHGALTGPLFLE